MVPDASPGESAGLHPVETRRLSRLPLPPEDSSLPPAARQMKEGYWLGAMIGPDDVALLQRIGIRLVLSAVPPDNQTLENLRVAQIQQVSLPMGDTFLHAPRILEMVDRYPPQEILIHCRHGADRTGAIAAFLLVTRHGWPIADAFYAVLYPSDQDTVGLAEILRNYGMVDHRLPSDPSVGFYSVSATGTSGGLKARNPRYARLVTSTIEAVLTWSAAHPSGSVISDGLIAPSLLEVSRVGSQDSGLPQGPTPSGPGRASQPIAAPFSGQAVDSECAQ